MRVDLTAEDAALLLRGLDAMETVASYVYRAPNERFEALKAKLSEPLPGAEPRAEEDG